MAVEFSLNTQLFLLSKRNLWLSDGSMGFGQESDVAFSEGLSLFLHSTLNENELCSFQAQIGKTTYSQKDCLAFP